MIYKVNVGDHYVLIMPTPFVRLTVLQFYLDQLISLWQDYNFDTEVLIARHLDLLNKVTQLLPRMDTPPRQFSTGWDVSLMSLQQVQDFFLYRLDEYQNVIPSFISEIHTPKESPKQVPLEPEEGQSVDDWLPPVPSCGNSMIDLMGQFLSTLGVGVLELVERMDFVSIQQLIEVYNISQQTPDDRRKEFLNKKYTEYKERNPDVIKEALGMGDFDPRSMFKPSPNNESSEDSLLGE